MICLTMTIQYTYTYHFNCLYILDINNKQNANISTFINRVIYWSVKGLFILLNKGLRSFFSTINIIHIITYKNYFESLCKKMNTFK